LRNYQYAPTEEEAVKEDANGTPAMKKEKHKKTPAAASNGGGEIDISNLDICMGVLFKRLRNIQRQTNCTVLYCEETDLGEEGPNICMIQLIHFVGSK
jgi:hypothetical protein